MADHCCPDLTVVVTTKDRPAMLERALRSTLRLSSVPIEVVVVDDGSTTAAVLPQDPRVRSIRHESSRGANAARNSGLAAARGRWICFLDDDDEHISGGMEAAYDLLKQRNAPDEAVIGTVISVDETSGARHAHMPMALSRGTDWLLSPQFSGYHAHNSIVIPTVVLRHIGGWNEQIRASTHSELFLRLLTEVSLVSIEEPMYLMYENPHRASVRKQHTSRARGLLTTLGTHDQIHGPVASVTADMYAAAGWSYAQGDRWPLARQCFAKALRADPTRLRTYARLLYALGGNRAYQLARPVVKSLPGLATRRPPVRIPDGSGSSVLLPAPRASHDLGESAEDGRGAEVQQGAVGEGQSPQD